jgi:hypothetical protein
MELLCPLCQSRLGIDDQYAGQMVRCPKCSGMFQAPTLPEAPIAAPPPPPPPPPPPVTFRLEEPPPPPPPGTGASPAVGAPVSPPPAGAETPPSSGPSGTPAPGPLPPLEGGFNHIYSLTFKQSVLSWVAVGGLALIFILSFFPWTIDIRITEGKKNVPAKIEVERESMWTTSVVAFVFYNIFFFLTLIFAVLGVLLDRKIISLPDPLKKMRRWRSLFVAGLAAIGYFALLIHWASTLNFWEANPNTAMFSIVMFVQFLVMTAPLLEYWLQQRKKDELPVPRIELRW